MSVKNFWTIFLKILGIWLVINGVTTITQFISALSVFYFNDGENWWRVLYVIGLLIVTIAIYFFILWLFVFKTSWLIDKLKLEQGFSEEKIEYNIHYSSIMTIAIIVIGGLIIVDSLPQFCKETFNYYQQKRMFDENFSSGWIFFHLVKTVLGYLLMTNSKSIVRFIESHMKENSDKTTE